MSVEIITERIQLAALAARLGVRPDWHEPDEQGVKAKVYGKEFDNAGFWGPQNAEGRYLGHEELHVVIFQDGYPVAAVNLATVLSWAADLVPAAPLPTQ